MEDLQELSTDLAQDVAAALKQVKTDTGQHRATEQRLMTERDELRTKLRVMEQQMVILESEKTPSPTSVAPESLDYEYAAIEPSGGNLSAASTTAIQSVKPLTEKPTVGSAQMESFVCEATVCRVSRKGISGRCEGNDSRDWHGHSHECSAVVVERSIEDTPRFERAAVARPAAKSSAKKA